MNCQHCRTTLYADDLATAPLCDLCHAEQQRLAAAQHAEVTPAGLNYLLPGVDPIHTTPPTEGQARLL